MNLAKRTAAHAALIHAMERIGWSFLACEINMHEETARIEMKRADGRLITLDARNGKATITREQQRWTTAKAGRRGDVYRSERLGAEFLGRDHFIGARHALKKLCGYLADNPVDGARALPAQHVRALVAPLMNVEASHG